MSSYSVQAILLPAMHGRWRFRFVDRDLKGHYLTTEAGLAELQGTDLEALARARALDPEKFLRIEAVSVGRLSEITDTPGRLLVFVDLRPDRLGWTLRGELMHPCWFRNLEHAVSYAAGRTAGYESETRILNIEGKITHVILIAASGRQLPLY